MNIRATYHAVASGLVIASREGWFGVGGSVVNSTFVPGLRGEKIGISRRTLHRKINEMNLSRVSDKDSVNP